MAGYTFREFRRSDLPMAARWLRARAVRRWWGNPVRELALLAADRDEPRMRQWIVSVRRRPFAYVQAYAADAWPQAHLRDLPVRTQVLDTFIGERDLRGRGHCSAFLRLLATRLIAEGAPVVAIDPDAANRRARRAFARAGFIETAVLPGDRGPVALMLYRHSS